MIDTNIIISALFYPNGRVSALLKSVMDVHSICIASHSLDEIQRVVARKFPAEVSIVDDFLNELTYELLRTPHFMADLPEIRDIDDRPILASAILADVDVLLTGDKDFKDVVIDRPKIMTPAQFAADHL
jgi:putative PIN family toxin of toxin-antitoxin system